MGKTGILIITICSNNKKQGGDSFIKYGPSILTELPDHAANIIKKRRAVFNLLKEDKTIRDGIEIADMQLNSRLSLGPDFGGNDSSLYMPAYQRYLGRFFMEVGKDHPAALADTQHHVLLISGLYGLLVPEEQIQAYSCHVDDNPQISEIFKGDGYLTSILLAYMNKHAIKRVLDLTGQQSYRDLMEWNRVAKKADTIHFYSEQYAGPAALPSLGELARTRLLLKAEAEILSITDGESLYLSDRGRVVASFSPIPPEGFPKESHESRKEDFEEDKDLRKKRTIVFEQESPSVLKYARDIPITSGEHNTIFNKRIAAIDDLPVEVQPIFRSISRCPDVLEVFLGEFHGHGPNRNYFTLGLSAPQVNSGHVFGKLEGPGAIARRQMVDVRVTRGREQIAYEVMSRLLIGDECVHPVIEEPPENTPFPKEAAMPKKAEFERYLQSLLSTALEEGLPYLDISAKELHELVGGYTGRNHRMPVCCGVMKEAMKADDQVLMSPPSGLGAGLKIRYYLGK